MGGTGCIDTLEAHGDTTLLVDWGRRCAPFDEGIIERVRHLPWLARRGTKAKRIFRGRHLDLTRVGIRGPLRPQLRPIDMPVQFQETCCHGTRPPLRFLVPTKLSMAAWQAGGNRRGAIGFARFRRSLV